jgi:hypothetical protein
VTVQLDETANPSVTSVLSVVQSGIAKIHHRGHREHREKPQSKFWAAVSIIFCQITPIRFSFPAGKFLQRTILWILFLREQSG